MQEVLESAKYVVHRARFVRIQEEALRKFAQDIYAQAPEIPPWDPSCHFVNKGKETVTYLLVLDALNFCFWPAPGRPRWEISRPGNTRSGYIGLATALKDAVESGRPILDPGFLADITDEELKGILGGQGELQLMEKRAENLRELGQVLTREYVGMAHRLVESAKGSALSLARILAQRLASFRDTATYMSEKVYFYKRAQIVAADLHGAFEGERWGEFHDMDSLTCFADYKLPQVLRHVGVLTYAEELGQKIDRHVLIASGSPEEVEIRAHTVLAVEGIRKELMGLGRSLRSFEIDWILWRLGQQDAFRTRPYHRTVTVFY